MVPYEPQTGDRTIGPLQLAASSAPRGHLQDRSQSASVSTSFFVVPANVSRAQPTPVTMKRGDYLPTRVLDGAPGRQQVGGVGDRTRITEPPEVLALSPERGAVPRIVAAVPERIQEHHIGRGERVSGRATLAQAGRTPPATWPGRRSPARWPGRWPAEVAGEVAGELAGELAGEEVAGEVAGEEVAGELAGEEVAGEVAGEEWPAWSPGKWPGRSPGKWPRTSSPGMVEVRLRRGRSSLVRVTRARMTPC